MLAKHFGFVHFGHAACDFFPTGRSGYIVQDGRGLVERNSLLCYFDELDAVQIHVLVGILLHQIFLIQLTSTLLMHQGDCKSALPMISAAPNKKGRKWQSSNPHTPWLPAGSNIYCSWTARISLMYSQKSCRTKYSSSLSVQNPSLQSDQQKNMNDISCPVPQSILTLDPHDSLMYLQSSPFAPFIFYGRIFSINSSVSLQAFSCQSLKALFPYRMGCWIGGVSLRN